MRTHEGNRPAENVQLYDSDAVLASAARLTNIHTALLPYMKYCVEQNSLLGLPVMRPLFFEAPQEEKAYSHLLFSYMLGDDVLVAPVVEEGKADRELWLPEGNWRHLWSGTAYSGGSFVVETPLGYPPVFFKESSPFAKLFFGIAKKFGHSAQIEP